MRRNHLQSHRRHRRLQQNELTVLFLEIEKTSQFKHDCQPKPPDREDSSLCCLPSLDSRFRALVERASKQLSKRQRVPCSAQRP